MTLFEDIEAELHELETSQALRRSGDAAVRGARSWIDVSSNDYLALGRESVSRETLDALAALSQGAGASRLIHGTRPPHVELETSLATWVGQPRALLFASGYAANVGTVSALARRGDLVVSDALNHASLIDGCRLSRAAVRVVPHGNLDAVRAALDAPAQRRWVLVEGYYSMDGESPDLAALRRLCDDHGAGLIVDEAHALGVFGPAGAGACAEAGVRPDVLIGAFGKAVGFQGAFAATSEPVATLLWNRARSFVFSTATSPAVAALALHAVERARLADARRERLRRVSEQLEVLLRAEGVPLAARRRGPIFPVIVGSNERALRAAARLREHGFLTQAIRPPTVPAGTARLRVAVHAHLSDEDVARLGRALGSICRAP